LLLSIARKIFSVKFCLGFRQHRLKKTGNYCQPDRRIDFPDFTHAAAAKLFIYKTQVNNNRTVSDTKRSFYTIHTRPINSIYRRVVEELMVEMHLLSANADFQYDPIYALGVVTAFDRFMLGYAPEADRLSIFNGLCKSLEDDPDRYKQDAHRLESLADRLSGQELLSWLDRSTSFDDTADLQASLGAIASNAQFKYSRLFAIGLFALLEKADADMVKDQETRNDAIAKVSAALHLPEDKVSKDLDLYRSNLEKMAQARIVLQDVIQAERKKREKRDTKVAASPSVDSSETNN
jgi:photosystem II biogenesis protein Psp29